MLKNKYQNLKNPSVLFIIMIVSKTNGFWWYFLLDGFHRADQTLTSCPGEWVWTRFLTTYMKILSTKLIKNVYITSHCCIHSPLYCLAPYSRQSCVIITIAIIISDNIYTIMYPKFDFIWRMMDDNGYLLVSFIRMMKLNSFGSDHFILSQSIFNNYHPSRVHGF